MSNMKEQDFYAGEDICEKCADKINIKKHIELTDYLVYINGNAELTAVKKETGEQKIVSVKVDDFTKISCANVCGYGKYIYVLCEDSSSIQRIDVDSDERTEMDLMCGERDFKPQCNDKYLLYQDGWDKYYAVDLETERTSIVKARLWNQYRLIGDKLYYDSGESVCSAYSIATKKSKKVCAFPEIHSFPFAPGDNEALNYDDEIGDYYAGKFFAKKFDEDEYEYRYYAIDLESGKIQENTFEVEADPEECMTMVMKYGNIFYATENDEPKLVRFNMLTGESAILEEDTLCVDSSTSSRLFRSSTSYSTGEIKVVGKWLYYESPKDERIHRIPIEGGYNVILK